ncbi:MAG: DUF933 domain-containing protein [bacterium]
MKIGIVGLPYVGKKTLFKLLTGISAESSERDKEIKGITKVRDKRLDELANIYKPKRVVYAELEISCLPSIGKNRDRENYMSQFKDIDCICYLARDFQDETVPHIEGSIDPKRDIEVFNLEGILADLSLIEKRLERIEKDKNIKERGKEKEVLDLLKRYLEEGRSLRDIKIDEDIEKTIRHLQFVSNKKLIIIINTDIERLNSGKISEDIKKKWGGENTRVIMLSAKIEQEINELEPYDRESFMKALGIDEPAINKLTKTIYNVLSYISFFTVGPDEVRAWTIHKGELLPSAGRKIHSDIERGFIRASVVKYDEFIQYKSESILKSLGKVYMKGKEYEVQDGDIITFYFNV